MQHLYAQFLAHPTKACGLFLIAFWFLVYLTIKVSHHIARRPLSDGPSLFPAAHIWGVIAFAFAAGINSILAPYGTVVVVAFHFGWPLWRIIQIRREDNK